MYNQQKNMPIFKVKDSNISAAVFNGQYGRSVSLQKYIFNKDTQQGRNENIFLNENDLLKAAFVLTRTRAWMAANPEPKPQKQQGYQQPQNQGYQQPQNQGQQQNPPQNQNDDSDSIPF